MDLSLRGGPARDLSLRSAARDAAAERLDRATAARLIGALCALSWLAIAGVLAVLLS